MLLPTAGLDEQRRTNEIGRQLVEHSDEATRLDEGGLLEPTAAPDRGVLKVMFSYAHLHKQQQDIQLDFFQRLQDALLRPPREFAHLPRIEIWRDFDDVDRTTTHQPQMDRACKEAFLGLLMLSDKYPHSRPCLREADFFLTEDGRTKRGKAAVVVRVNLKQGDLPDRFSTRLVHPLQGPPTLLAIWAKGDEHDKHQVVQDVARAIFQAAATPTGPGGGKAAKPLPDKKTPERYFADQSPLTDQPDVIPPRARKGQIAQVLSESGAMRGDAIPIV